MKKFALWLAASGAMAGSPALAQQVLPVDATKSCVAKGEIAGKQFEAHRHKDGGTHFIIDGFETNENASLGFKADNLTVLPVGNGGPVLQGELLGVPFFGGIKLKIDSTLSSLDLASLLARNGQYRVAYQWSFLGRYVKAHPVGHYEMTTPVPRAMSIDLSPFHPTLRKVAACVPVDPPKPPPSAYVVAPPPPPPPPEPNRAASMRYGWQSLIEREFDRFQRNGISTIPPMSFDLMVEPTGRASDCRVVKSSRNSELDSQMCDILSRSLFRTATDSKGAPVRGALRLESPKITLTLN